MNVPQPTYTLDELLAMEKGKIILWEDQAYASLLAEYLQREGKSAYLSSPEETEEFLRELAASTGRPKKKARKVYKKLKVLFDGSETSYGPDSNWKPEERIHLPRKETIRLLTDVISAFEKQRRPGVEATMRISDALDTTIPTWAHSVAVAAETRYYNAALWALLFPAALLHDVVEDTTSDLDEILENIKKGVWGNRILRGAHWGQSTDLAWDEYLSEERADAPRRRTLVKDIVTRLSRSRLTYLEDLRTKLRPSENNGHEYLDITNEQYQELAHATMVKLADRIVNNQTLRGLPIPNQVRQLGKSVLVAEIVVYPLLQHKHEHASYDIALQGFARRNLLSIYQNLRRIESTTAKEVSETEQDAIQDRIYEAIQRDEFERQRNSESESAGVDGILAQWMATQLHSPEKLKKYARQERVREDDLRRQAITTLRPILFPEDRGEYDEETIDKKYAEAQKLKEQFKQRLKDPDERLFLITTLRKYVERLILNPNYHILEVRG